MNFPLNLISLANDLLLSQQVDNYPSLESMLPDPLESEIALRQELSMYAIDEGLIQSPEFDQSELFEACLQAAKEICPV